MRDRIGVIGEQRQFILARPIQTVAFLDQPTQRQHAQADRERVLEVLARNVNMGPGCAQALEQRLRLGLKLDAGACA